MVASYSCVRKSFHQRRQRRPEPVGKVSYDVLHPPHLPVIRARRQYARKRGSVLFCRAQRCCGGDSGVELLVVRCVAPSRGENLARELVSQTVPDWLPLGLRSSTRWYQQQHVMHVATHVYARRTFMMFRYGMSSPSALPTCGLPTRNRCSSSGSCCVLMYPE